MIGHILRGRLYGTFHPVCNFRWAEILTDYMMAQLLVKYVFLAGKYQNCPKRCQENICSHLFAI